MAEPDKAKADPPSPDIEEFLLRTPLYSKVPIGPTAARFLKALRTGDFHFDAYCTMCGRSSTFRPERQVGGTGHALPAPPKDWMFRVGKVATDVHCQRDRWHIYRYETQILPDYIFKYGQLPSMEDIAASDLLRFRAIMKKEDFSELHRAGGLASHGIGIGAFVYLRRIFERLINETRDRAAGEGAVSDGFDQLRMDDKIGELAKHLPPALVKNRAIYGILSKGLHELSEDTCLTHFGVIRAAILQILEQDLEAANRKNAERQLEIEVARIAGSLNSPKETSS